MADMFEMLDRCQDVLFGASFRRNLSPALEDAVNRLRQLSELPQIRYPEQSESMYLAGLQDIHLTLKLSSFESSLNSFMDTAREDKLEDALDKGGTILGSLAGAIPGFGSFAQELVDFLLKELRKRLFGRR
jgi:hypothetical protein